MWDSILKDLAKNYSLVKYRAGGYSVKRCTISSVVRAMQFYDFPEPTYAINRVYGSTLHFRFLVGLGSHIYINLAGSIELVYRHLLMGVYQGRECDYLALLDSLRSLGDKHVG